MIELLVATIVGQMIIGPNLIQTDYLTPEQEIITVVDSIQEVPF